MANSIQIWTGVQLPCLDSCGNLSKPLFPVKQKYLTVMYLTFMSSKVFRSLRRWSLLWERVYLAVADLAKYPTGPSSFL